MSSGSRNPSTLPHYSQLPTIELLVVFSLVILHNRGNEMRKKIWLALTAAALVAFTASGCGSGAPWSGNVSGAGSPAIVITYLPAFTGQTAAGTLYLVVDMTIENKGYRSFNTSPDNFSVQVNRYSYPARKSDLPAVDLGDGDRINGKLTFQVPAVAATTRVGYKMEYSGQGRYDLQWLRQADSAVSETDGRTAGPQVIISHSGTYMWDKTTRTLYMIVDMAIENRGYESFNTSPRYFSLVIGNIFGRLQESNTFKFDGELTERRDGAFSDLRSYDLQNGGRLTGKLAFKVPPEVMAATRSYELKYSGVRSYNIQWNMEPVFQKNN